MHRGSAVANRAGGELHQRTVRSAVCLATPELGVYRCSAATQSSTGLALPYPGPHRPVEPLWKKGNCGTHRGCAQLPEHHLPSGLPRQSSLPSASRSTHGTRGRAPRGSTRRARKARSTPKQHRVVGQKRTPDHRCPRLLQRPLQSSQPALHFCRRRRRPRRACPLCTRVDGVHSPPTRRPGRRCVLSSVLRLPGGACGQDGSGLMSACGPRVLE